MVASELLSGVGVDVSRLSFTVHLGKVTATVLSAFRTLAESVAALGRLHVATAGARGTSRRLARYEQNRHNKTHRA